VATTPDYTILSSPRISAATFASILRGAGSPAAGEASAEYRAFVNAGVDPTVGLAVFRKESTFGRFGRANLNRSWGNIRNPDGSFRRYPSWTAGAADAARLLAIYGANRIRPGRDTSTVQTFPYVWAPSSDGNAPDRYGDQLAQWIHDWSGQAGIVAAPDATLASSTTALKFEDLVPPGTTVDSFKAAESTAGVSTADDYRLTQADADAIARQLKWPQASGLASSINLLIYQALGQPNSFVPGFTAAANQNIADALSALAKSFGDALVHVAILLAILGLLAMGVWLVATSKD